MLNRDARKIAKVIYINLREPRRACTSLPWMPQAYADGENISPVRSLRMPERSIRRYLILAGR
jgi:hypothetical protein